MNKKCVGIIVAILLAVVTSWNYQQKESLILDELGLANVEALAQSETTEKLVEFYCSRGGTECKPPRGVTAPPCSPRWNCPY